MLSQTKLNRIVAEVLEVPEETVQDDSDLEELGWDSLSNVTFLSIADERLHRRVDPEALGRSETPADLLQLLG